MKQIVVGATALLLIGLTFGAGAATQRALPFTLLVGNETSVEMGDGHPSHRLLYVVSSKAGANKLMGLVEPEDQERLRQVDFRRFIVVAVFRDFPFPDFCRKNLAIRRIRLIAGRVDVTAAVEDYSCVGIPEIVRTHLYSVASFPRRFAPKVPKPGQLSIRVTPSS